MLDKLSAYDGDDLTVVIDTPKGSQNKFAFEPRFGAFVLKGVLPAGAVFPFDFGFVPSTRGDDGDPIDGLVLMDAPAFVSCIVPSRLIGAIQAEHREGTNRAKRPAAGSRRELHHAQVDTKSYRRERRVDRANRALLCLLQPSEGQTFVPKRRGPDGARTLVKRARRRANRRWAGPTIL